MTWSSVRTVVVALIMAIGAVSCTESKGPERAQARPNESHADPVLSARLERALDRSRRDGGSPGAQAAVVWADGTMWTGSSGEEDVHRGTGVTDDTLFAMGSTTKAYTAALILDLAEDDVLSLEDALADWVPDFDGGEGITLRQLLLHTSGLAQIAGSDIPAELEADANHHLTTDELILDPACSPGTCYHYQSPDYGLLGEVVERATGNAFAQELRERVLQPLELERSFIPSQEKFSGPVATGYGFGSPTPADRVASERLENVDNPYPAAAGGLLATTGDVARYTRALFSGGLLRRESRERMLDFAATEGLPGIDECNAVGLGVVRGSLLGEETWGHGGFTGNFHSAATFFPRYELTVTVVVNDGGDTGAMTDELAELALAEAEVARPDFVGGTCNYDIYLSRTGGGRQQRLTTHPATDASTVTWAPSGREIAFGSDRNGDPDVYVMGADGDHERPLTTGPANDVGPAWSPDGSRIAFWSDRDGDGDIYVMARDGSQAERLTSSPMDDILPAWSPDGRMIAFVSGRPGGSHDLWVMNADGSDRRRLTRTRTDEWWPTWSPDGTRIAYVFDHRVVGGGGIKIFDFAAHEAATFDVAVEGPGSPAWGPDGRIAFVDFSGDIWTAMPDGSRLTQVTHTGAKDFGPGWSPDGRRLAFPSQRWQTGRAE